MSSTDPDWWSQPHERPPQHSDDLAEAAASMRDAAEYLRDAATPAAPPKERDWDLSWLTDWVRYTEQGQAARRAVWSVGPLWTFFLWSQRFPFWDATGMSLIAFVIVGGLHLRAERKTTRLLTWGVPIGLAYYAPVAIVFGLAKVLVGG
ncbi:hypothetical protein ABZ135_37325 [Streptomyces sp. NPDC006339]|uniref:hypothetical protein n=1 Tax=Streptomyces sp. NPDC006339 TaxID=3156755 RepID=UPI0033B7B714